MSNQGGKASTGQTRETARKSPSPDSGLCCSMQKSGADLANLNRGQGPYYFLNLKVMEPRPFKSRSLVIA